MDGSNPKAISSRLPCKQPAIVGASESIMSCRPEQLTDASAKSLASYLPMEDLSVGAVFTLSVVSPIIGFAIFKWLRTGLGDTDDVIIVFLSFLLMIVTPTVCLCISVYLCMTAPEEIRGVRKWSKAIWQRNVIGRTLIMDMYGGKPRYFIDGDARANPDLPGGAPRADVDIFNVPFSVIVNLARPRLQSCMVCGAEHGYMHFIRVQCVVLNESGVTLRIFNPNGSSLQFPDKTALMALASEIPCLDLWVAYMMRGKSDLEAMLGDVKRERNAYKATVWIAMEALDASHRFIKSKQARAIREWLLERQTSLLTHDPAIIDGMPDWPRDLPRPERTLTQGKDRSGTDQA